MNEEEDHTTKQTATTLTLRSVQAVSAATVGRCTAFDSTPSALRRVSVICHHLDGIDACGAASNRTSSFNGFLKGEGDDGGGGGGDEVGGGGGSNRKGLRSFYNKFVQKALSRRRWPNRGSSMTRLEAVVTWMNIILISIPWLSFILFYSFLYHQWNRRVPLVNAWAQFILRKILKINLHVSDTHSYGSPPYVFVLLNQSSLLESLLIVPAAVPPHIEVFTFANLEFLMIPFLGWVFWKTLKSEMVIRQNKNQARSAISNAIRRMREQKASIIISIEGKRSVDGSLSPFKRGPVLIAIETGATIIPIVIKGSRDIWKYGDWKIRVGGDVIVKFLNGIETKGLTLDDRFALTEKLRRLAESELGIT